MTYRALIPVKSLSEAKSRLAAHLTIHQREMLVLDMLHHVLEVLLNSEMLEQVYVVSPDRQVLQRSEKWGAQGLLEEVQGHNPALSAAASRAQATTNGALEPHGLLTISADLPLLEVGEIHHIIEESFYHDVVLAPSPDGTGTNAILMRPPLIVPYLFGPNSLRRYLEACEQRKLSVTVYSSTGLALDIDTIDDLDTLRVLRGNPVNGGPANGGLATLAVATTRCSPNLVSMGHSGDSRGRQARSRQARSKKGDASCP